MGDPPGSWNLAVLGQLSFAREPQRPQLMHAIQSRSLRGSIFLHGKGGVGLLLFARPEHHFRASVRSIDASVSSIDVFFGHAY